MGAAVCGGGQEGPGSMSSSTSIPLSTLMSMCSNIGEGDDQASPQGGTATTAALPAPAPAPSQMVVVALEATLDHRDEDIRMALSRFAAGGEIHILRGGDSLHVLESIRAISNPRKCVEATERLVICTCGLRSVLYIKHPMAFPFTEIKAATSDFSKESLLGEGGFGYVYKGQLKDGQVIAAKLLKNASLQGYSEFFSEVQVLSFARHRNIVGLLGYCYEESHNILVYEYVCNNSLDWHLFDKSASLLEWHTRHAIALGIAKGLRFLHEECRAGPIIHLDLRPSNVLLTHDFIPMLGDFGLAKWKASNGFIKTRILGQSGYLAPEYAEYGIVSVKTDVYAFGILLFQLISGHYVLDERGGQLAHILQWAEPLIESLALHELIDDRINNTYDTYGLYHLARAAYLCVRTNPEKRPSMGEVVRLIEPEHEHVRDLSRQFIPDSTK